MLDGESRCEKLTMIKGSFEAVGKFRSGVIDKDRLLELEEESCPSAGSCQGMYTANTIIVGIFNLNAAISIPGVILSQFERRTKPSS